MSLGWVYILSNPSMPGVIKIGQSSNDPAARANELYTTGVPEPFLIEYKGLFEGYAKLERSVHDALSDSRRSSNREFFEIEIWVAVDLIRSHAETPAKYEEYNEAPKVNYQTSPPLFDQIKPTDIPVIYAASESITLTEARRQHDQFNLINSEHGYKQPPSCPRCGQRVTVPLLRLLKITCPNCREPWVQPT